MVGHTAYAIQFCTMAHDLAVCIDIKLTFVCLLDSGDASVCSENDMIDEVGVTHSPTKIT